MRLVRSIALLPFVAIVLGADDRHAGVVVESVGENYAAARAGLREGDLILAWSRGSEARGEIQSPFDLLD